VHARSYYGCGDAGGEVAVADQLDAGSGFADVADGLGQVA